MSDPEDYRAVYRCKMPDHAGSADPEDYYRAVEPLAPDDKPSLIALAVLWAAGAVVIMLGVALLLAGISVLIGGHYWWLRS